MGRGMALGHGQRCVQQRLFQPGPRGLGRDDAQQAVLLPGKDLGPDIGDLRRPQPGILHPCVPLGPVPASCRHLGGPVGLGKEEVPDLVRPFHMGAQIGGEALFHIGREGAHIGVIGHVGQREPGIGTDAIGKIDHDLDRNAPAHPGIVVAAGPVGPDHLRRGIGIHPIHEAQHAQVADAGDPVRVEDLAKLMQGDVIGAQHDDIADRVGGVGRLDPQGHRAFARGEVEPRLVIAHLDRLGTPADPEGAPPLPGDTVAPGGADRLFRQIGQDEAFQRHDPLGQPKRPPLIGQVIGPFQRNGIGRAPLLGAMADPGPRRVHEVDEGQLRGPVRQAIEPHAERGIGDPRFRRKARVILQSRSTRPRPDEARNVGIVVAHARMNAVGQGHVQRRGFVEDRSVTDQCSEEI